VHFFFEVLIPKNTTQAAPYKVPLPLSAGVITRVEISIPAGHAGTAHLQVLYHEFQLYPLSRGENYHGDDSESGFDDLFEMTAAPYELRAIGWNTDTVNDHRFLIGITVLRPEQLGLVSLTSTIKDLAALVGETIEV
jgi:hypothetical protein